ncbi:MAG: methylated-DNA--[protein]-cysteine S-methyltransferase [Candidatus Melainabacteria bacterium]|jgi:O-6-methylguanine DNA methyltransferase|nr:methylated-DNA--[protein]-cysteine S-methyltransferase [Candidatus Melainabacteria bacterium]MBX9674264.1 methylated-DNA--[protein]-cysteine S-methyltransferase [Candidatus Obscuribacterales bacterium]
MILKDHDLEQVWWQRLVSHTATRDEFVFAVTTTGMFCKPTCASAMLLPNRHNVRFYANARIASADGYHACPTCHPPIAAVVSEALAEGRTQVRVLRDQAAKIRHTQKPRHLEFAVVKCYIGAVLVAFSELGVCYMALGATRDDLLIDLRQAYPHAEIEEAPPSRRDDLKSIIDFIDNPQRDFPVPLDIKGTPFQMRVWDVLRGLPVGITITYAQLAERTGAPRAIRAVANACAANHIAIAIPCHRVVRNDGTRSGYRWGIERKREILKRELESL